MKWIIAILLLLVASYAEAQTRPANWNLTWTDTNSGAAQEDGTEVFSAPSKAGPFTSLTKVKQDAIAYTHTVAADPGNTTICFQLQAYNSGGKSPMSNIACGTSPVVNVAPGAVNVSVSVTVTVVP